MQFIKFKYYLKYLFAIVNIKVHHLAQRVEDLDAKFFALSSSNRLVCKQPADESAIVALFTCFRDRLEKVFRSIKDIDNDGRLGLNKRMKLSL
jgi:hypothetical protein